MDTVGQNTRGAALPVSADYASGSAVACSARVALVWAWLNVLPAPDSCRVLRLPGERMMPGGRQGGRGVGAGCLPVGLAFLAGVTSRGGRGRGGKGQPALPGSAG